MLFDSSEHEPDEYDPEADLEDPDADGPTIPSVSTDESDVPGELLETFWIVVAVVNAAVFALSLGAMLLAFRGDATTGGGLLVGGVVLLALAYRRYRRFDDGIPDRSDGEAETVSGDERVAGSPEESTPDDENRT